MLEQSHREQNLSQCALQYVIPTGPAIQNQAFPKKCVEENERRRENDFSADAIGPAEVGEGGCKQVLGIAGRIPQLFAEPPVQWLPVVMVDAARELAHWPVNLHAMSVPLVAIPRLVFAVEHGARRIQAGTKGTAVNAVPEAGAESGS